LLQHFKYLFAKQWFEDQTVGVVIQQALEAHSNRSRSPPRALFSTLAAHHFRQRISILTQQTQNAAYYIAKFPTPKKSFQHFFCAHRFAAEEAAGDFWRRNAGLILMIISMGVGNFSEYFSPFGCAQFHELASVWLISTRRLGRSLSPSSLAN
jgi:hypothetical protein